MLGLGLGLGPGNATKLAPTPKKALVIPLGRSTLSDRLPTQSVGFD